MYSAPTRPIERAALVRGGLFHCSSWLATLVQSSVQGGCFETSKPPPHEDPTYVVDGVVHYCVANMPGAAPRTSSEALNNATLPFGLALADKGLEALRKDPHLARGLNVLKGEITYPAVAEALGLPWSDPFGVWARG